MVDLIPKTERDTIGLTSWWRAMTWAALCLRATNTDPRRTQSDPAYPHKNKVGISLGKSISNETLVATLTINADLPYSSYLAMGKGASFIPFLIPYSDGPMTPYSGLSCATLSGNGLTVTGDGDGLPDDPSYVSNLEHYFLWVCREAEKELLDPTPSELLPITIDFLEEASNGPVIRIKILLGVDYLAYVTSQNLVCSVLAPSVQAAIIPAPPDPLIVEWDDITNKPSFHAIATSGNYSDLTNSPSIPSDASDLNDYGNLVRSVNGQVPNPNTGAVDITVNVGSVEWSNVTSKPSFHAVATSGSYNSLTDTPSIPNAVSELTGYDSLVRSINDTNPDPVTGNVTLAVVSDWSNITNKPTFSAVAFSGSYNDLTDQPVIPEGSGGSSGLRIDGTKTIFGQNSDLLVWASDGDNNGVIHYLGTNNNTQAFSNPLTDTKIDITNNGSTQASYTDFVDQNLGNSRDISTASVNLVFDLINYTLIPDKITIYNRQYTSSGATTFKIQGSNDNTTWDDLGQFTSSSNLAHWDTVDIDTPNAYRYFKILYESLTGSSSYFRLHEIEFYGELFNNNVTDGSLVCNVPASDVYYVLIPDIKVGSFILPDLSEVFTGAAFYFMNPHPTSLTITPAIGQTAYYTNNFATIDQNKTALCFAISATEWAIL